MNQIFLEANTNRLLRKTKQLLIPKLMKRPSVTSFKRHKKGTEMNRYYTKTKQFSKLQCLKFYVKLKEISSQQSCLRVNLTIDTV